MIHLNPFAISGLLITATYLPLCLFLIVYGRTRLARVFFIANFIRPYLGDRFIFNRDQYRPILSRTPAAFFVCRALAIPVFLFHTSYIITRNHRRWLLISIYALFLYFLYLNLFGKMMDSNRFFFNSFYFVTATTPYTLSFIFWISTVFLALLTPYSPYYKKSFHKESQQVIVLLLGGIGCAGGLTNFFMAFGLNIFPYGNFAVPLHSILCSYAILKHHMLGINVAINRGMVYSILIFLLSSLYLILVVVLEKILQAFFAYNSAVISILAAFVIGLICFPLRAKIQAMVDELVFHKSPQEIANENDRLWPRSSSLNGSMPRPSWPAAWPTRSRTP